MRLPRISRASQAQAHVRASWCATLEAAVGDLSGIALAGPGARLRAAIADAGEIGWIDAPLLTDYLDAALDRLGDERLFGVAHANLLTGGRSPLLRRTCASAVRLFGATGVAHGLVPAWELVTRGCAEIRAAETHGPAGVDAVLVEFARSPEPVARSWAWAAVCRAWLQASVDTLERDGLVEQRLVSEPGALRFCVYVGRAAARRVGS